MPCRPLRPNANRKAHAMHSRLRRQVGNRNKIILRLAELQTVTGLTALKIWILFGHLGVAAGTGMVAVQPMNGKKVTLPRTIGDVRLGVTYGTGHVNLAIFRHIMMTGSTPKTLVHLMGKSDVHPFALCILDNMWIFHNFTHFLQRSRLGTCGRNGYQTSGNQHTKKDIFHIQSSFERNKHR